MLPRRRQRRRAQSRFDVLAKDRLKPRDRQETSKVVQGTNAAAHETDEIVRGIVSTKSLRCVETTVAHANLRNVETDQEARASDLQCAGAIHRHKRKQDDPHRDVSAVVRRGRQPVGIARLLVAATSVRHQERTDRCRKVATRKFVRCQKKKRNRACQSCSRNYWTWLRTRQRLDRNQGKK